MAEAGSPVRAQRILLADDSPVTRDILQLLLTNRGHNVDTAEDGEAALAALQTKTYDVVLMDFHLPKMDGLAVTAAHRAASGTKEGPRFIAITADVKGLLAHGDNCETFDEVLAKPFEIDEICRLIESERDQTPRASIPMREATPAGGRLLRWPADFSSDPKTVQSRETGLVHGHFDAVLIEQALAPADLVVMWQTRGTHVLPVVDLTGTLGTRADLDKAGAEDASRRERLAQAFRDRRRRLSPDLLLSDDLGHKLIGRLFVSGTALEPSYDPTTPAHFSYNTLLDTETVIQAAGPLHEDGFLRPRFFDRFHICAHCGSARQNVREQCTKCRSANLREESYLHHFRCAHQGPESSFTRGHALICPKCSRELLHLGTDYDRPGAMMVCAGCGHTASDAVVGFVCLDCRATSEGPAARTRDALAYTLTERGITFAETGRTLLGERHKPLRLIELPLELILALNPALSAYQRDGTEFVLLDIAYRSVPDDRAPDRDTLLGRLHHAIGKRGTVVKGRSRDFALVCGLTVDEARTKFAPLIDATDLDAALDVFGPNDFS